MENKHPNLNSLPEFLNSQHLVDLGLYPTVDATYQARKKGEGPDFIKLRRKIIYPKAAVVNFLEQRLVKNKTGY